MTPAVQEKVINTLMGATITRPDGHETITTISVIGDALALKTDKDSLFDMRDMLRFSREQRLLKRTKPVGMKHALSGLRSDSNPSKVPEWHLCPLGTADSVRLEPVPAAAERRAA